MRKLFERRRRTIKQTLEDLTLLPASVHHIKERKDNIHNNNLKDLKGLGMSCYNREEREF